jgi:hypothetical protein
MDRKCSTDGIKMRKFQQQKPKCKRLLWRPRCSWEDNINTKLKYIRCEGVNWFQLAQGKVVNFRNPYIDQLSDCQLLKKDPAP